MEVLPKVCSNKECKHYSKETDKLPNPKPFCSLKCKYDDPDFSAHNPYAD